jgi:nucleoside-diphosphate-sugar epimerase
MDYSDINDYENISKFINIHKPDIVIHCAGIAHQQTGKIDYDEYIRVNSLATKNIAEIAAKINPFVHFIFLSSISVYGENNISDSISEDGQCKPSSDYGLSKLDAERCLMQLYNVACLKKLDILRLAPVYDFAWSLNLDKRVFAPKKLAYLKFGSGDQEMSAVSRQNLTSFIDYRINQEKNSLETDCFCNIINVCDEKPYKFKEIINIFKQSNLYPNRLVLGVPLLLVWMATRLAGLFLQDKRQWIYSCHDKLKFSLVFDNTKMLNTGFNHINSLESVFLNNKDND